ncbi:hypothetical protein [Billgrantia kenyensis]|uniref:Uncharacterized protein n=1 Tax=Billgrantia kenyensis TaxID=321266 RepID=A0A7W0AC01_9GAMM|nr:hypothetical protein [Halomonas kenyensis]MBA2777711.1 hypothetical protein [Halomonas kenyensis]MCG6660381.1 hypothetical protein [Halomonas kenyensis]
MRDASLMLSEAAREVLAWLEKSGSESMNASGQNEGGSVGRQFACIGILPYTQGILPHREG